jgi:hypothetical protein
LRIFFRSIAPTGKAPPQLPHPPCSLAREQGSAKVGPSFGITLNRKTDQTRRGQEREARHIGCDREHREKRSGLSDFFLFNIMRATIF